MALAAHQLQLAPLGAGDLIDRAVRLYRRHFMTLIRISAPPVVLSAVGSVLWTLGYRQMYKTPSSASLAFYLAVASAGVLLLIGGNFLNLIVMGGATRNLVTHLLWNEPVSARATYAAVRARFWSLLGASLVVSVCLAFSAGIAFFAWYLVLTFVFIGLVAFIALGSGWLSALVGVVGFSAATVVALCLFFFLAGRFAYVPQAMMVEGKSVFEAVSRSTSLARGNVKRLMAMTLFTWFATYSALMILIVPLGWYGYLNGIDPSPWRETDWPAWYAIGYNVVWQSSSILLAPVWMLGLSLLYVDERVRHEGYDVELMAARRIGEMPTLAGGRAAPLAPAIVTGRAAPPSPPPPPQLPPEVWPPGSTLGLR